jgi:hypothetical protein
MFYECFNFTLKNSTDFFGHLIFNVDKYGQFFNLLPGKICFQRLKVAMGATGVKVELPCLYVQIWMDLRRHHCS